jgi:predicted nucleic acid-binding protein
MSNILIDTSAWIEFFRPHGDTHIRNTINQLLDDNEAALCGIILSELLRGTRTDRECRDLADRLGTLVYLSTPEELWWEAGRLGSHLTRKGVNTPTTDILIATVAIENKVPLLHKDRHFPFIARYSDLKLVL